MTSFDDLPPLDPNEVLATAGASPGRRFLGLVSLGGLGLMLLYLGIVQSPALEWRVFLLVLGAGTLWLADKMRRATLTRIEITETELRDTDGTVIALVADIDGMDRGFFAFKPSNGFLLHTETKGSNEWRPGLWWRVGRRIGVGGMTPAHQSKHISEILAVIMAKREMEKKQ
jgi:hypothetical protein